MTAKTLKIFLLNQENLRLKLRIRSLTNRLVGQIKSICFQSNKAADEGHLRDKSVFEDVLQTAAANFHRKKNGQRYKTSVKEFYKVIMYWSGPRLATFIAINMCGPEKHTLYRWRNKKHVSLLPGIVEETLNLWLGSVRNC